MAPAFYKILFNPSDPHLPLPPAFINKHLKNKIPNGPIIITADGGYTWRLKIKKIGESYCFTSGWKNVVEDISLDFANFLFFQLLDDECSFKMTVYNPNGCENILPQKLDDDDEDDEDEDEDEAHDDNEDDDDTDEDDNGDDEDEDPFFTITITKTHTKLVRFPSAFVALAGIDAKDTMLLKNLDGKEWLVSVRLEHSDRYKRYLLSSGWSAFRKENNLNDGDKCEFRFIKSEDYLLLANVTKK